MASFMTTREPTAPRFPLLVAIISIALTVFVVVGVLSGGPIMRTLVLTVGAMALGAYVATTHPLTIFRTFAAVLGFAPFIHVPGTSIPLLLVLAVGIWVALVSVPGVELRPGWCEAWVALIVVIALLSVAATDSSVGSFIEYAAWVAATATVVPVRFLPAAARISTVQVFVVGAAAASVAGMLLLVNSHGLVARALSFTGIDPDRPHVQVVAGSELVSTRLNGTYFEANIAGFVLAAALLLCLAVISGRARVLLAVIIGTGLLLTLSRSAMATVAVALILVALRTGGRRRARLVLAGIAGVVAAVAIPAVRSRLLDSFGPTDTGTAARLDALNGFARRMHEHWVWGLGWDRPEFRDASSAFQANLVANTPLATVYRGGVILGLLIVVVMILLVVRSWRFARRGFREALIGCSIIAFLLVALQLDYPVVTQPCATILVSMLVAMSMPGGVASRGDPERLRADSGPHHR